MFSSPLELCLLRYVILLQADISLMHGMERQSELSYLEGITNGRHMCKKSQCLMEYRSFFEYPKTRKNAFASFELITEG